mmetsp:Transcript_67049/g.196083  ORF Transcript_67049/g.196083 Transcript_67049/m.196083 type:complete len:216 (-) Transcript_67049:190-837(-)
MKRRSGLAEVISPPFEVEARNSGHAVIVRLLYGHRLHRARLYFLGPRERGSQSHLCPGLVLIWGLELCKLPRAKLTPAPCHVRVLLEKGLELLDCKLADQPRLGDRVVFVDAVQADNRPADAIEELEKDGLLVRPRLREEGSHCFRWLVSRGGVWLEACPAAEGLPASPCSGVVLQQSVELCLQQPPELSRISRRLFGPALRHRLGAAVWRRSNE